MGISASPLTGSATITPTQASDMMNGLWYVNLHTTAYPTGEIRGQLELMDTDRYAATYGHGGVASFGFNGRFVLNPGTLLFGWNIQWSVSKAPR